MPLRDHFHPPLSERRRWHSFHHAWATVLAFDLNKQLPPGYFADPNVKFGIEIGVAAWDEERNGAPASWQPPAPTLTVPLTLVTDTVEVQVFYEEEGPVLAGAIELVSPANKDRPESRDAFVSKCAALVQEGIGLVVVDVVTNRGANLHADLLTRVSAVSSDLSADLWAASYRPLQKNGATEMGVWYEAASLGQPLPVLPFWLKNGPCLRVDFEAAYARTVEELGIRS